MLSGIRELLKNLIGLIYPDLCIACYQNHPMDKQLFCLPCGQELIRTEHLINPDNEFMRHFVGRVTVQRGASLFIYRKGTSIQQLLHQLKYNNKPEVGFQLGLSYSKDLLDTKFLSDIDMMIPVPLYWKKQKKRGYNQSEQFAKGIHQSTNIPILTNILLKDKPTASQTKMSRAERVDNVASTFIIKNPSQIQDKHILLVDDVLTTGATLEACAKVLLPHRCKISMLTIAMGKN